MGGCPHAPADTKGAEFEILYPMREWGGSVIKTLTVMDIIRLFERNVLVQGEANRGVVRHVITETRKNIHDHTLVFHLDREPIDGKYWAEFEDIVLVTDTVERCSHLGNNIVVVQVTDMEAAYWGFVDFYRNLFSIPVIGITGTAGKTTTKEMIKHILRPYYKVQATYRNVNSSSENLRYLLGIDDSTEAAVFEMPVAGPGYLSQTCKCFQPTVRVLLNIGVYHLTDCDTPEGYLNAKAEIVDGLDPSNGVLVLNADDQNTSKIDVSTCKRIAYFGLEHRAHFRGSNVRYAGDGMRFDLHYRGRTYECSVPGVGEHQVSNALAALAAVSFAGVEMTSAISRLGSFEPIEEHLEFKTGPNGCTVIDDTWNITPLSMAAALDVLNGVSNGKTKIAVLGYMPRLGNGDDARREYANMGDKVIQTDVHLLVVVGDEAGEIGQRALALGMDTNSVHFCTTGHEVYEILKPHFNENSMILLKITHRVMVQSAFVTLREQLIPDN